MYKDFPMFQLCVWPVVLSASVDLCSSAQPKVSMSRPSPSLMSELRAHNALSRTPALGTRATQGRKLCSSIRCRHPAATTSAVTTDMWSWDQRFYSVNTKLPTNINTSHNDLSDLAVSGALQYPVSKAASGCGRCRKFTWRCVSNFTWRMLDLMSMF